MAESVMHSSPSFRFHHHPNSSNYLTSNENHHAVVVGRTVEFGCMQECQAEREQTTKPTNPAAAGNKRGETERRVRVAFAFAFPAVAVAFLPLLILSSPL